MYNKQFIYLAVLRNNSNQDAAHSNQEHFGKKPSQTHHFQEPTAHNAARFSLVRLRSIQKSYPPTPIIQSCAIQQHLSSCAFCTLHDFVESSPPKTHGNNHPVLFQCKFSNVKGKKIVSCVSLEEGGGGGERERRRERERRGTKECLP